MKNSGSKFLAAALAAVSFPALFGWDLVISMDRSDGKYKVGETATFTIKATGDDVPEVQLEATLSVDSGKVLKAEKFAVKDGLTISGTLDKPGFLKVAVDTYAAKKRIKKLKGAAFEAEKILPGAESPADFKSFWDAEIAAAEKTPLDAQVKELEKSSVPGKYKCYSVSVAAPGGRVYGFLTVPESDKPMPLVVMLPASGGDRVAPVVNQFGNKWAVLYMNVTAADPLKADFGVIRRKIAKNYPYLNSQDKTKYFFHRVILGFNRVINLVAERKDIDKNKIGVFGTSQGGGLSLMIGAINPHIKGIVADVPAMCDHFAASQGRRAGWPRLVNPRVPGSEITAKYYDVANFAKLITVPTWVIVGFEDDTCPPGSVYAAFNQIPAEKKVMIDEPDKGHSNSSSYGNAVGLMRTMVLRSNN